MPKTKAGGKSPTNGAKKTGVHMPNVKNRLLSHEEKKMMNFARKWMEHVKIILNEVIQTPKDK